MYNEDFVSLFFEFLHEYSNETEMLNALKPFIEYGWGTIKVNGTITKESEASQTAFIQWMCENGASMDAIKAAIKLLD